MQSFRVMDAAIEGFRRQVREHPVARLALSRQALNEFALVQHHDSEVWVGWLAIMRDRAENPVLRKALQANALCEVGDLERPAHVTLALNFVRSLGLEPCKVTGSDLPRIGQHAAHLFHLITTMTETEICGWIMATEALVPEFFAVFLPLFEGIAGVDTTYLTEHIRVDAEDHMVWMKEAAKDILRQQPEAIGEIIFGVEMAGRSTLAVPDAMFAEYSRGGIIKPAPLLATEFRPALEPGLIGRW